MSLSGIITTRIKKFGGALVLVLLFTLSLIIIGCNEKSTHDQLLGQWKIKSCIDLETNRDIMKDDAAPCYFIDFQSDSVHILERESNKTHRYKFKWTLNADSLKLLNFVGFRIESLSGNELNLTATEKNIFSEKQELYTHEIQLIRAEE